MEGSTMGLFLLPVPAVRCNATLCEYLMLVREVNVPALYRDLYFLQFQLIPTSNSVRAGVFFSSYFSCHEQRAMTLSRVVVEP